MNSQKTNVLSSVKTHFRRAGEYIRAFITWIVAGLILGLFCGSLNCPISSILLGIELFGASNLYFFAIACAVSYMLSANFGLYREQMIIYSKLKLKEIDKFTD